LAVVICDSPRIIVEADDYKESRFKIIFSPFQAMRMVTIDCFDFKDDISFVPQTIVEVQNSTWIDELKRALKLIDPRSDFMTKSRHFILPLQDDILEIVAWGVEVKS